MRATWPLHLARLCARRMKPRSSDAATQLSWSPLGRPPESWIQPKSRGSDPRGGPQGVRCLSCRSGNNPDSRMWRAGPSRFSPATVADHPSMGGLFCRPGGAASQRVGCRSSPVWYSGFETFSGFSGAWKCRAPLALRPGPWPGARSTCRRASFPGPSRRLSSN